MQCSLSVRGLYTWDMTLAGVLSISGDLELAVLQTVVRAAERRRRQGQRSPRTTGAGTALSGDDGAGTALTRITGGSAVTGTGALTDARLRWSTADNATWSLDNIVIRSVLP